VNFALNHMTTPRAGFVEFLGMANQLGCVGVEVRNDLSAEVKEFNRWSETVAEQASQLIELARSSGAQAVSLIPVNSGSIATAQAKEGLRESLSELQPRLKNAGLTGLIEPLGFASCSLRYKSMVVEVIRELDAGDTFKLIHDTFHHALSGEEQLYPEHTAMVHVSGVVDAGLAFEAMQDEHRVLVDAADRLGNVNQLAALFEGGYKGPVSFEVFSPKVHVLTDPLAELNKSIHYIESTLELTGLDA